MLLKEYVPITFCVEGIPECRNNKPP